MGVAGTAWSRESFLKICQSTRRKGPGPGGALQRDGGLRDLAAQTGFSRATSDVKEHETPL